jgi:hypothetical protein
MLTCADVCDRVVEVTLPSSYVRRLARIIHTTTQSLAAMWLRESKEQEQLSTREQALGVHHSIHSAARDSAPDAPLAAAAAAAAAACSVAANRSEELELGQELKQEKEQVCVHFLKTKKEVCVLIQKKRRHVSL